MGTTFELAPGRKSSVDDQLIHTYTRVYNCTDDTGLDEHGIGSALGLPIGTAHPTFPYARVANIDIQENEGSGGGGVVHWVCTVTYKNRFDDAGALSQSQSGTDPAERQENPVLRAPDITVSGDMKQIPCVVDINRKSFTNTMGDPLLPPQMRTVPSVKITVGRNFLVFPSGLFESVGKVNSTQLTIPRLNWSLPKRSLKLVNATANPAYENGMFFWAAKFTIEMGTNVNLYKGTYLGWDVDIANMGKRCYDEESKKATFIKDELVPNSFVADPKFLTSRSTLIKTIDANGDPIKDWERLIKWLEFQPDAEFDMKTLWS